MLVTGVGMGCIALFVVLADGLGNDRSCCIYTEPGVRTKILLYRLFELPTTCTLPTDRQASIH